MRRKMMVLAGIAALLGGCGAFSAHSDTIEEAAGQRFTAQRLSDILTSIHGTVSYDTRTAMFVTTLWTDLTLFSQAVADNKLTTDSAFVAEAMWPAVAQATAGRWIDTVLSKRIKISDAQIAAMIKQDSVRAVQHLLVHVDSTAPKEDKDKAMKKVDSLLAVIRGGANFGKVAIENTDDPGSKPDSGWYGLKPRATWDPPFGTALWALKPGEVSGVVKGHYGFHIIRRPSDAESAKFWRDSLIRAAADTAVTTYYAELNKQYDVKVDGAAGAHIRAALEDVDGHAHDNSAITTYKGGSFTAGDFIKWIAAAIANPGAGADWIAKMKAAPDSELILAGKMMTQNSLLLKEAAKNHVSLTPEEWKEMQAAFKSAVDTLKADIGLTPDVIDPKASSRDRERAAAEKIDQYFNDLVAQKKNPKPLPGILSATLRAHEKTHFNAVALQNGIDLAKAKHSADSTKANPSGTAPTPGDSGKTQVIKPAAGPPPGTPPSKP